LSALAFGTVGPLLLLLVALGWRFRDHALAGVMLALAAAAKLFLWPVLVWLVVTRRWRGTAAAAITLASVLLVWLLIDPTGLRRYPETVRALNTAQQWKSYSVQSLVISIGLPRQVADAVLVVLAFAAVAGVVMLARRRADRRSFGIAVIGALLASPILWLHYLVLLPAPIALIRPRLSALWFVPLVLWTTPHPQSFGTTWEIVVVLAVIVVIAAAIAKPTDTVAACSTSRNDADGWASAWSPRAWMRSSSRRRPTSST
jgi:glycosyl transferase family 87